MGYYTYYELRMWDANGETIDKYHPLYDKIKAKFINVFANGNDDSEYANKLFDYLVTNGEELKWYECHEDMMKITADFPEVMFEMEGTGEDREDWWIEQYYKGNYAVEFAKIIPPRPTLF